MTLIEMMVVVFIASLATFTTVVMSISQRPGSTSSARWAIASAMNDAAGVASGTGNGATIVFDPGTGPGGISTGTGNRLPEIRIYAGRPNGSAGFPMPTRPIKTIPVVEPLRAGGQNGVNSLVPFAVFMDGFGRSTYGPWNESLGTIAIPTCVIGADPLTISFSQGPAAQSMRMPCGGLRFDSYNAANVQIADPLP